MILPSAHKRNIKKMSVVGQNGKLKGYSGEIKNKIEILKNGEIYVSNLDKENNYE